MLQVNNKVDSCYTYNMGHNDTETWITYNDYHLARKSHVKWIKFMKITTKKSPEMHFVRASLFTCLEQTLGVNTETRSETMHMV